MQIINHARNGEVNLYIGRALVMIRDSYVSFNSRHLEGDAQSAQSMPDFGRRSTRRVYLVVADLKNLFQSVSDASKTQ